MNLQQVLDANELNRNSYNTLERRTGLAFMKRELHESRGRDKYLPAHAVALGCVLDLQSAGVPAAKAAAVVDGCFHWIWNTVAAIAHGEAPGWSLVHVVDFEDGTWGFSFGAPDASTLRNEQPHEFRTRTSVNVITVLKRLHARANAAASSTASLAHAAFA